jgi:hypothetical protein
VAGGVAGGEAPDAEPGAAERDAIADLEQASALYRDRLLDGLNLPDAPMFDAWLAGQRERWGQRLLRVLSELVAAHRATGTGRPRSPSPSGHSRPTRFRSQCTGQRWRPARAWGIGRPRCVPTTRRGRC